MSQYEQLLSPTQVGGVRLKNRIMSSGHQTSLTEQNLPTDDFIAYHRERAEGGVGLIVLEAHAAHHTALNTPVAIDGTNPELATRHRELVRQVAPTGARVFAQMFHNGSEAYTESYTQPVVAPSAVPTERFHLMPRELEGHEIEEIVESFANTARNLREAGIHGVELGGSHGYLFTQFWSPRTNLRTDQWGGSFDDRMRFSREVVRRVHEVTAGEMALGMRISIGAEDGRGLSESESLAVVADLDGLGLLDYWSIVVGSSRTYEGASYIVPPASEPADLVLSRAARVRELTGKPVMATSRVRTADQAEKALAEGAADVIGMTRALIADPHLPDKLVRDGHSRIVPCIACNQGCIGRYQQHLPIRCTVNPRTGREGWLGDTSADAVPGTVLIVGGGPAGLSAALAASERGHTVTLVEERGRLGGQMVESHRIEHKRHFTDWPAVMGEELERRGVTIRLNETFGPERLEREHFDAYVLATGAEAHVPRLPLDPAIPVLTGRDVLAGGQTPPGPVIVVDWESRWTGIEAAETLALRGTSVEIVSASYGIAEGVQQYIRNKALARLDRLGVTMTPAFRLSEVEGSTVRLHHVFSRRLVEREGFGSVVLCYGGDAGKSYDLHRRVQAYAPSARRVGDALAPRALEEAIWEGHQLGGSLQDRP